MPTNEEKERMLKKLPRLEMDVMFYFGQGMTDDELCTKLGIEQKTLNDRFTAIFKTLKVEKPEKGTKKDALNQEYSRLVPNVCRDEDALKRYRPTIAEENENTPEEIKNPPEKNQKEPVVKQRNHINFGIPFFAFLVVVVVAGAYLVGRMGNRSTSQPSAVPTQTYRPTYTYPPTTQPTKLAAVIPSFTVIPSPTFTPTITIIPTDTPIPPTDTPTLSPTPPQPFTDNFDNGIGSAWNIISGTWITANGRLTVSSTSNDWSVISLSGYYGDNFIISLNVSQELGDTIITVKKQNSQVLAYKNDYWGINCWVLSQSDGSYKCIADNENHPPKKFSVTLRVEKNTYILSINGLESQRFTSGSMGTPFISISTFCGKLDSICTSFDDFKIEPLP